MKKVTSTNKRLAWIDQNLLAVMAGLLIAFIPLYPKIPLLDIIPGYIVRVRLEDLVILVTVLFWLVQLYRQQAKWHPLITKLILAYLAVGFLSTLSAMFITRTVPLEPLHVGKLYLHYLRRIEYFSLFFILYSALKTKKQARIIIFLIGVVMLAVTIYGYGQKYFYWPVYSTMNREFSKGWRLYLTEHARVPSTFGGHYDAAAFTMMVIPLVLGLMFYTKNKFVKWFSFITFLSGLWLLILTASRTSFIGYLVGVTVLFVIIGLTRSIKFAIPRWLGVMFLSLTIMLSFGDLSERYAQVFKLDQLKEKYGDMLFKPKVDNPVQKDININPDDLVSVKSDQPPTPVNPGLPGDVYEDIPDKQIYFDDAGDVVVVEVQRTYSDNAYKYGLSAAIRLDALWPRAVAGFTANPLLGTGYSTLTKESVGQFTEAESTDNDYLRSLGETGLLGFITFFGVIAAIIIISLKSIRQLHEPMFKAFTIGFIAASVALLVNALYIDVFEASKVAQSYWAFAGIVMALPLIDRKSKTA